MSIRVLDLELSEAIEPIWGMESYERLYALVRHHGRPVGWIGLHNQPRQIVISPERLRETITQHLGWELLSVALGERLGSAAPSKVPLAPISVVVCTHEHTLYLARCLRSLLSLEYPDYEVIVVDSAPSNDDTAQLVADFPVRYVREGQPGPGRARNRGIIEARNDIVAFVEDDVLVDRQWLRFIANAFAEQEVMAVTGLIAPAELETNAQVLFEFSYDGAELSYGGLQRGLRPRVVKHIGLQRGPRPRVAKRGELTTRELLWASSLGGGANMAFRRRLFVAIGPFDVTLDMSRSNGNLLGVGASNGSGAIEMLHRVVASGHTLMYEPAALVWRTHNRDLASLRSMFYDNARAFGVYLLTCARNGTVGRRSILRFALKEWLGRWIWHRFRDPRGLPRRLIVLELAGALVSPLAYKAARKRARL